MRGRAYVKLQFRPDALRLRIDEAELEQLLAGAELVLCTRSGKCVLLDLRVGLAPSFEFAPATPWRLCLPEAAVLAYVETLPRREALVFEPMPAANPAFRVEFEVDVRDSVARRGPGRRGSRG